MNYKFQILNNYSDFKSKDWYVNIGNSLWQHDIRDENNYINSMIPTMDDIDSIEVFKVSKGISLKNENLVQEIMNTIKEVSILLN